MKKYTGGQQRRPKTWLGTGSLAAVPIAYVLFIFLPAQNSIGELRSQVQEHHQQILQAQSMMQTVTLARKRLAETREVSQQWQSQAPRPSELITRLASLTQQAEAAGVAIARLDPAPAVEMQLIGQQEVTLQFHASFTAVFDLARRLEALPGSIWVRSLRLDAAGSPGELPRGELTVAIFVNRADYSD